MIDLSNVKTDNDLLDEGAYPVVLEDAQIKDTKDGTGEYINCKFSVQGGDYDGRKVYMMFNLKNKNAKAVEIGQKQLKAFMEAAGMTTFKLTSPRELEGLRATAMVKKKTDDYGEKNVISYFKAADPSAAARPAQAHFTNDVIPF